MRPDRSCFIPLFGELRIANVAAQTRIVSVARIRLDSRKSVRPFKGIICADISEFESHMRSHAVGLSALDVPGAYQFSTNQPRSPVSLGKNAGKSLPSNMITNRLARLGSSRMLLVEETREPVASPSSSRPTTRSGLPASRSSPRAV